jgi:hypothetical protein
LFIGFEGQQQSLTPKQGMHCFHSTTVIDEKGRHSKEQSAKREKFSTLFYHQNSSIGLSFHSLMLSKIGCV